MIYDSFLADITSTENDSSMTQVMVAIGVVSVLILVVLAALGIKKNKKEQELPVALEETGNYRLHHITINVS